MISKNESKAIQGFAVLGMLLCHLFNKLTDLPYEPLLFINGKPLVYFLGLLGDCCVPIFSFTAGYAQYLLFQKNPEKYAHSRWKRILSLLSVLWLIIAVFSIVGLFVTSQDSVPGSFVKVLLNAVLYTNSLNGAWWYMNTYVLLVISFPLIRKLVDKLNGLVLLAVTGILYLAAYYLEFVCQVPDWGILKESVITYAEHYFRCLFPFIIGCLYNKYGITDRIKTVFGNKKWLKWTMLTVGLLLCLSSHIIIKSPVVSPLVGIGCVTFYAVMEKPVFISVPLEFLGKHSTNIWLVHMFFVSRPFKNLVYIAKYPFLIFLLLLVICLAVSYALDGIRAGTAFIWKKLTKEKSQVV